MDKAEFGSDAKRFFENTYTKISSEKSLKEQLFLIVDRYLAKEDVTRELNCFAESSGLHRYTADMLMLLICFCRLYDTYKKRGFGEELFKATVEDLGFKLRECLTVYGIYGTFVIEWYAGFFDLNRFKLGRLQFEKFTLKQGYKDIVLKGGSVINCHIPSCGRLEPEEVEAAFKKAYDFYGFKTSMPVICESWLLYPPCFECFPEGSNIREFIERFDIIDEREEPHNPDAWRIFNTDSKDIEKYPKDTALQRNFYDYLKNGGTMGEGLGILIYRPKE